MHVEGVPEHAEAARTSIVPAGAVVAAGAGGGPMAMARCRRTPNQGPISPICRRSIPDRRRPTRSAGDLRHLRRDGSGRGGGAGAGRGCCRSGTRAGGFDHPGRSGTGAAGAMRDEPEPAVVSVRSARAGADRGAISEPEPVPAVVSITPEPVPAACRSSPERVPAVEARAGANRGATQRTGAGAGGRVVEPTEPRRAVEPEPVQTEAPFSEPEPEVRRPSRNSNRWWRPMTWPPNRRSSRSSSAANRKSCWRRNGAGGGGNRCGSLAANHLSRSVCAIGGASTRRHAACARRAARSARGPRRVGGRSMRAVLWTAMRIGPRWPSWKGRIAARTSWRRYARHSLGLKAPRGWGWITNPRKAAYNRIYSRHDVRRVQAAGAGAAAASWAACSPSASWRCCCGPAADEGRTFGAVTSGSIIGGEQHHVACLRGSRWRLCVGFALAQAA